MNPYTRECNISDWDFKYIFTFQKVEERFDHLWQMKASARRSLKDWLLASNIASSVAEVCANACSELIENALKYATNESITTVAILASESTIVAETLNKAGTSHITSLRNSIETINKASDVKQLFVEKLLLPVEGESHLGLVKIIMETKGTLEFVPEQEEDCVHVKLSLKAG